MSRVIIAVAASSFAIMACTTVPTAQNKRVAARVFQEVLAEGHFERAAQLYAPTFRNHGITTSIGLEEDQGYARGWKQAFPDLTFSLEAMVAEDDLVSVLWIGRGTNTGTGNGLPATGRSIALRGITIWRIVDGRITDEWSAFDELTLLKQLGLADQ